MDVDERIIDGPNHAVDAPHRSLAAFDPKTPTELWGATLTGSD